MSAPGLKLSVLRNTLFEMHYAAQSCQSCRVVISAVFDLPQPCRAEKEKASPSCQDEVLKMQLEVRLTMARAMALQDMHKAQGSRAFHLRMVDGWTEGSEENTVRAALPCASGVGIGKATAIDGFLPYHVTQQ